MNKVGKTTRPYRYDLNQISYDYTVEVRNRFKGLDLIARVPDELWTEVHDTIQETGIKTIHMEKKCKKAKWLSEEALQITEKKRSEKQGEKERYKHLNAEYQRIARRDKKAFLSNQCKLEVVKQEMARVNVDILGISKLIWTGMGEFNSDDHYIYYCWQESLRRNGVAIMVNKRV